MSREIEEMMVSEVITENPAAAAAHAALRSAGLSEQEARAEIATILAYHAKRIVAAGRAPVDQRVRRIRSEEYGRNLASMLERLARGERARDIIPTEKRNP